MTSYAFYQQQEFARVHEHFRLLGQDNLRRYLPIRELRVRMHPDDSFFDLFARVAAARTAGCRINASFADHTTDIGTLAQLTENWSGSIEFVEESEEELATIVETGQTDRIRYATPDRVPAKLLKTAAAQGFYIARAPVLAHGRIELLWYYREQSISDSYHRYGNLGEHGREGRAEVL